MSSPVVMSDYSDVGVNDTCIQLTKGDIQEGPEVIWDVDKNLTNEIYEDLGVGELDEIETSKQDKNTQLKPMETLTTPEPSSTRALARNHIHNGKKCSCIRRILNSGEKIDRFSCLPDEILLYIFRWFQRKTLVHCAKVCKRWRRLVYDDELWRRADLSGHTFQPGILGMVLQRGMVHAKLSRATINAPVFPDDADEFRMEDDGDEYEGLPLVKSDRLHLESLDLSGCIVDDHSSIDTILTRTSFLRHLSLESCCLRGQVLTDGAHRFASLRILDISMCRLATTAGLPALFAAAHHLQSLNMSWMKLSKADLQGIIPNLAPTIQKLNISGYREKLVDDDVETLVRRCPDLEELDLSDCTVLTQASISTITEHLSKLQHISLSRCYDIPFYAYVSLDMISTLRAVNAFGAMQPRQLERLKSQLSKITIDAFHFSSIARPTTSPKQPRHIWGEYCDP